VFFPTGYLAPPSIDPTLEEQAEIRQRLAHKIGEVIPWWLSPILLGPKTKDETIRGVLDPLSSPECNAHLMLFVLDAILMTVFPELGELTDASLVERYSTNGASSSEAKESEEKVSDTGIGEEKSVSHIASPANVQRSVSAGSVFTLGQS